MTDDLPRKSDVSKNARPLFILLMFFPCLISVVRETNNDIWFLLNSGRYVMEHGIPYVEPFTIHQGFEFVMQQWLSSSIFWLVYSNWGTVGLNFLVLLCHALTIYILYRLCMMVSDNYFFFSFTVAIIAGGLLALVMTQRPCIFSTLILALELLCLEGYLFSGNRKYLLFLPILSLLLINLHAAMWPMIFVIALPYLIDSLHFKIGPLLNQGYKKSGLLIALGIMFVAGFLNPYGIDAMTYLFKSYGYPEISNYVFEMRPPNVSTVIGGIVFGALFVVALIYMIYRKGTTKWRYILLTLGTAYMTLSSVRNFSFFVICGLFPLAYYLKDFEPQIKRSETTPKSLLLRKILIGLIIAIIIFGFLNIANFSPQTNANYNYMRDTINFIYEEKHAAPVKLYTGYDDGGMAEFLGIPSYLDPRAEVFVKKNNKKSDVMKEYILLQKGSLYYKDFLVRYQFTHLIVTQDDILYTYLRHDQDYRITFSNEKYTLFEKKQ